MPRSSEVSTPAAARLPRERRSPTPGAHRKREAIQRLKSAMAEDRLALYYQPIFAVGKSEPAAAEALLRWRDPDQGGGDLHALLAAAEKSPVIFALEEWGLRTGFAAGAAWAEHAPGLRLNLNLSARGFRRTDLVRRVRRAITATGIDPTRVTLEITETSSIHNMAEVTEVVEDLKRLGVELWLDDFGTGHSSLEWLSRMPVDGLKIPGCFVERLPNERRSAAIVCAIVGLARELSLMVVAEGVESEEQRKWLEDQGCDFFQGFLFCGAMPEGDLRQRLFGK